jgi:DNA-directed RNA polymerase specialized sigma54-like protein
MSTALVTALRESCGYLRDDGYHQTAQLMTMAADEIERLNRRVQSLESGGASPNFSRGAVDRLRQMVNAKVPPPGPAGFDPRRYRK